MAKYWFRQKRFGYGATPNTWQGWLFTAVGIALIVGITMFTRSLPGNDLRLAWTLGGLAVVLVPFLWITYVKTEGGWRWRSGNDD